MKDQLHIIITGNQGKVRSLILSRKKIRLSLIIFALILCTGTALSSHIYNQHRQLNKKLTESKQVNQNYAEQIAALQALNTFQAETFLAEKEDLVNDTVNQLNERNQLIETVMSNIGIPVNNPKEEQANSGGPYLPPSTTTYNDLLNRSDRYLEAIRTIPLGWPHRGKITSKYGGRQDPFLNKRGFHSGIDLRGKTGEKIYATADGQVIQATRNGGYGLYVEIDHGNGYRTGFAHLSKYLVKKGDKVSRGQIIGLLGNTGRSTGPHLHYEIQLHEKTVNPYTFMSTVALTKPRTPQKLASTRTKKIYAVKSSEN